MARRSLRQSAAGLPLARWLVAHGEAKGWTSARQAATYLKINPAVFGTWLRGEFEPDAVNQERLAEATGEPVERIAELVRETRAAKRARAAPPAPDYAEVHNADSATDPAGFVTVGAGDAAPQPALSEAHFFGLVSELGTLTDAERAAVLPVLREIVGRRRRGRSHAGGGGTRDGDPG